MIDLFLIGILVILFGGILSILSRSISRTNVLLIFLSIGTVLTAIPAIKVLIQQTSYVTTYLMQQPLGDTVLCIDALSAFFILLIDIICMMGIYYGIGYLKAYSKGNYAIRSHLLYLTTLFVSMLLVVTVQNALVFLIVWEVMSLSSFLLVLFEHDKKEVIKASMDYFLQMHISVVFLIIGFCLCSLWSGGGYNFASFRSCLSSQSGNATILFILFFIGFGIKAGIVPFHTWLPKAHPAAPGHVSAIMSAVMIKMGVYGILRILLLSGTPSVVSAYIVLGLSLFTAIWGILYAIMQKNIKKLLAYSSVENMGIIGMGIGVAMLGAVTQKPMVAYLGLLSVFLHILNHGLYKGLLFFSVSNVYQQTHEKNMELLGGLAKPMRYTSKFALLGVVGICGLPPLNGFVSEFLLYLSLLVGISIQTPEHSIVYILSITGLSLVGAMAIFAFCKFYGIVFLGSPRSDIANIRRERWQKRMIPMVIMAGLIVVIGFFPQFILAFIERPVSQFLPGLQETFNSNYLNVFWYLSYLNIGFVVVALLLYRLRKFMLSKAVVTEQKTWGCGYQAATAKMQYTGTSYADSFLFMIKPLVSIRKTQSKITHIFPSVIRFKVSYRDTIEKYIVQPIGWLVQKVLLLFTRLQSGNTQNYLLYGLLFLFLVILSIVFTGIGR